MNERVLSLGLVILIAIDQLAQTLIFGIAYLLGFGPKPLPQETISSVVGRNAVAQKKWALIAERPINLLFELLGDGPDHCRRSIIYTDAA